VGSNTKSKNGFDVNSKIKTKKFINDDSLILFLKLKPLTPPLSPQMGRGDTARIYFKN
jgi:hypothetical protein